ncbi:MAG: hypothetical protein FIB01_01350 [Gemmatimonadetes bacterium]|nr:hypothetical protein [Gemmatimonadota bacterium]
MVPAQAANSSGLLPNDRTHLVKLSGAYRFKFGLESGAFFSAGSGSPLTAIAPDADFELSTPVFVVPRGSAGRTPALWNLDLRLAYTLSPARGPRSRIVLDVLHVGNPRRATVVDEVRYTALDEYGNPASPNPAYRKPVSYQAPMGARLGVEIGF